MGTDDSRDASNTDKGVNQIIDTISMTKFSIYKLHAIFDKNNTQK